MFYPSKTLIILLSTLMDGFAFPRFFITLAPITAVISKRNTLNRQYIAVSVLEYIIWLDLSMKICKILRIF